MALRNKELRKAKHPLGMSLWGFGQYFGQISGKTGENGT
jgi:hypothetical protein